MTRIKQVLPTTINKTTVIYPFLLLPSEEPIVDFNSRSRTVEEGENEREEGRQFASLMNIATASGAEEGRQ